jgi:hypothetical protein
LGIGVREDRRGGIGSGEDGWNVKPFDVSSKETTLFSAFFFVQTPFHNNNNKRSGRFHTFKSDISLGKKNEISSLSFFLFYKRNAFESFDPSLDDLCVLF